MSKGTDLKIRVVSNLSTTQQVLLYQQDIQTDAEVKNFLAAAWEHPRIAPKDQYDVTLPKLSWGSLPRLVWPND